MSVLLINASADRVPLRDKSVHTVVTSPPYYGLRDYGLPPMDWPEVTYMPMAGLPAVTVPAWRGCLGLEPDPLMFMGHIVLVFREVRRVLRDDGTCWMNFGDTYSGGGRGGNGDKITGRAKNASQLHHGVPDGLKPKDLTGIPWRVAFALQADGWYLRSDVIWNKTAPMPESVNGYRWERHRVKAGKSERAGNTFQSGAYRDKRQGAGVASRAQREAYYESGEGAPRYTDCPGCKKCAAHDGYILRRGSWRPTKAHEYVFMLAKSADYFADKYAVEEDVTGNTKLRGTKMSPPSELSGNGHEGWAASTPNLVTKRNMRDVWQLAPSPYPGAHFATYPPDLVRPCIMASTSEHGVCPHCGAPWARVVEKGVPVMRPDNPNCVLPYTAESNLTQGMYGSTLHMMRETRTIGWRPTCDCPDNTPVPATVLDPFVGSGTTLQVARELGRNGVGLDYSFSYLRDQARPRLDLDKLAAFENGTAVPVIPAAPADDLPLFSWRS